MLDVCFRATLGGHFGKVDFLVLDLHIPTSRDMLNIVLGTTLGLNMAVVRFFGDYLDLECYRMENNTREEDWLELSYGRLERML